tara:strand:- start:1229 stop:1630 length:402 start_codon:yes stop_codon:yes gene_type:complete
MQYILQVKKNAKMMAKCLIEKGYNIISNGTENHLMLIDLSNKDITGKVAENTLGKADITINKNMVPFDKESPFITSGMRIGSAAITTRGMKEKEMKKVVFYIDEVLKNRNNEKRIREIKKEINKWMVDYPLFK